MSSACFQVSKLGVDIISIHASAGLKALKDSKNDLEGKILQIGKKIIKRFEN